MAVKHASIVSVFACVEPTRAGQILMEKTFLSFQVFGIVAALYSRSAIRRVQSGEIWIDGIRLDHHRTNIRQVRAEVGPADKVDAYPAQLFDEVTSALDPELVREVMDEGRIVEAGTAQEIFDRPRSPRSRPSCRRSSESGGPRPGAISRALISDPRPPYATRDTGEASLTQGDP